MMPFGIYAGSFGPSSLITIGNNGTITATGADTATGIFARSFGEDSPVSVVNSGNITINAVSDAFGIYVESTGDSDPVSINNSGNLAVSDELFAFGIKAATYGISGETRGDGSPLSIVPRRQRERQRLRRDVPLQPRPQSREHRLPDGAGPRQEGSPLPNDILVFGVLGGFVNGTLDYDNISRAFDFEGGQVGGYATYLRGGLFVDTLANVHLFDVDTHSTMGFPGSLNAATVGVRTDSGYRFGSFKSGPAPPWSRS